MVSKFIDLNLIFISQFHNKNTPKVRFFLSNFWGAAHLQIAFLELDKYNKGKHITDEGRQWLEFFGNLPFSKEPSQAVTHADSLLDSSSWTQEEKAMIDERIRIQENYDMTMETAIDEAREEGLEKGLERGRHEGQLELIRKMLSKGLSLEVVSDVTGLSVEELETLLS